jgi:hypothetical protein
MAIEISRILHFDAATGVASERPATDDELAVMIATAAEAQAELERQRPLEPVGALATLLAVTGTLSVEDAANAVRLLPADLIAEAEAWSAATPFPEES